MIMGLLHRDVTLLNFDNVYPQQRQLARLADEWIQLTDIREANLFCTDRSRSEISRRLPDEKAGASPLSETETTITSPIFC